MKKNKNIGPALKNWLKNAFTKNIVLKIVSLIFAMLLWGYVLMTENPQRTKTITNVPISVEGEADLIARKLVLCGNKDHGNVTVKVNTQLTSYSDLSADDITASINLSNITEKGEHELVINTKSATGTAVSTNPDRITIKVDDLVSRAVPIEVRLEGEIPQGYWSGDIIYSRTEVTIEGPAEDVAKISNAVGVLDLSNITDSISKSLLLTLYDNEGGEMDPELFYSKLPSVTVRMEVLPMKTVPIDVDGAIIGADSLPKNYELVGYGVNGTGQVRIIGEQDVLDQIHSIGMEMVDITGSMENITEDVALIIPDGVRLLDDDTVNLHVNIREKNAEELFESVPIDIENLGKKLNASLSIEAADMRISGRISLINAIDRGDVKLYVDLSGLESGTYQVPVEIKLPEEEMMNELIWVLSADTVTVNIH
ncbi:MAG: CdaR family protein [Eubacteriales bacterium]|jgi:YbbR domain-containing protein|nr:CdaR family protein [Clostridiales bacterium]MDY5693481.1 CdaR family protein [Eubacteriales bacterium]